jgi:hypothetical protein
MKRMLSMSKHNMNTMMTNREMALAVIALPFQAATRCYRSMCRKISGGQS